MSVVIDSIGTCVRLVGGSVSGGEETCRGKVDRRHVRHVKQHELDTAQRLADLGENVKFVPEPGEGRSADVEIDGVRWEMKSPTSANRNTLGTRLGRGSGQAENIIFDIARTPIGIADATAIAESALRRYSGLSVIWIVGRDTADGPLSILVRR